jgi:hypothetical protein
MLDRLERPVLADCVEKVLFRLGLKILGAAGASLSFRGEGPHQLPQKRSLALASILQSLAPAEIANALHLRVFRSPAIFEFFNTIGAKRPLTSAPNSVQRPAMMFGINLNSSLPLCRYRDDFGEDPAQCEHSRAVRSLR